MRIENVKIDELQVGDKILSNDIVITGICANFSTPTHYINGVYISDRLGDIFGGILNIERQTQEELTEVEISEKVAKIKDLQKEVEALHQKLSGLKAARSGDGGLTAEEIADGWITYDGKGCPVNENDYVYVLLDNRYIPKYPILSKHVIWNNSIKPNDCPKIIAYKITDNKR